MDIFIFRTSIHTLDDRANVAQVFAGLPGISRWTVDLEDCDRVLRVVCTGVAPSRIEHGVRSLGYECEELPD